MLHICIWGMPAARLVTLRGKHENILSDKFSTIENLGFDMLGLSRPASWLIALFRKKVFDCFDLRKKIGE